MAQLRWLRNKRNGYIYEWSPILSENPSVEEVSEEEAFPERFIPEKQKGRASKVNLTTEDVPAEEVSVTATDPKAQKGLPT